jgi:hypothetical protein
VDKDETIKNLKIAVNLLLPHAETLADQREIEARDKPTVAESVRAIRRDILGAKELAGLK